MQTSINMNSHMTEQETEHCDWMMQSDKNIQLPHECHRARQLDSTARQREQTADTERCRASNTR